MTEETSLEDGPLTGLRVVEFGQLIAGPYVGTLLADFDADVIKVEARSPTSTTTRTSASASCSSSSATTSTVR